MMANTRFDYSRPIALPSARITFTIRNRSHVFCRDAGIDLSAYVADEQPPLALLRGQLIGAQWNQLAADPARHIPHMVASLTVPNVSQAGLAAAHLIAGVLQTAQLGTLIPLSAGARALHGGLFTIVGALLGLGAAMLTHHATHMAVFGGCGALAGAGIAAWSARQHSTAAAQQIPIGASLMVVCNNAPTFALIRTQLSKEFPTPVTTAVQWSAHPIAVHLTEVWENTPDLKPTDTVITTRRTLTIQANETYVADLHTAARVGS